MLAAVRPAVIAPTQAAAYIGLSRSGLYRLVAAGALPRPLRITSGRVGFKLADLDRFIATRPASTGRAVAPAA